MYICIYVYIYIYVTLLIECNNLQETQQQKHDRNTLLKKTRWDFVAFLAGVLLTLNPEIVKLSPEPWIPSHDSQMFQCVHLSNPKNYSGGIQMHKRSQSSTCNSDDLFLDSNRLRHSRFGPGSDRHDLEPAALPPEILPLLGLFP